MCGANEDQEHATLCEKKKEKREEWAKEVENKLKKVEQHRHAEEAEKEIVKEIFLC